MRVFHVLLLTAIVAAAIAACANDPYQPGGGGGCTSPLFQGAGNCQGSPPPPPSPTPTPSATPTAWPHEVDKAYDGQNGGIGVAATPVDTNVTFPMSSLEDPSGTPKAITDCFTHCDGAELYEDIVRIDRSGQPSSDFATTCAGGASDNCFVHTVGPTPLPTVFPTNAPGSSMPTPNPGDRTCPAGCGGTKAQINNSNPCQANVGAWWGSLFQGTQSAGIGHVNAEFNLFKRIFLDTNEVGILHATKSSTLMEILSQSAWESCLYTMDGAFTHVGGAPYLLETNSLQYGQAGTAAGANGDGDLSCDNVVSSGVGCLDQFSLTGNIDTGDCEFCVQNGVNGPTGTGLVFYPRFVNYALNVASQIDALGKSIEIIGEAECGHANCGTFTGPTPAPDAAAPISDRMGQFATVFMATDNGPNAPSGVPVAKTHEGQPANVISNEDFNNHNDNVNSIAVFDEQYIVPIGDPNVQARAYVHLSTGGTNGFGRCDTADLTPDTGGSDDYAISGTCDGASGKKSEPVLRKCYHHFSYHGIAYGDICVFLNLSTADHTIVSGDHTGYTLMHTYLPASTCTQSPNCGDYITGGTSNSQCPGGNGYGGSNGCAGSITAGTFTDGSTKVLANGGVVVATP